MDRQRIALVATMGACASAMLAVPGPVRAQESGTLRAAAVLSADTVQVGVPFTVGIIATSADSVRFPPLLDAADGYEQLELAALTSQGSEKRAYYRLVAWEAGRLALPPVTITTGGPRGRTFEVALPGPEVVSVLPAGVQDLRLQPPRPPAGDPFPWWMIALGVVLAALIAWWTWRRLHPPAALTTVPASALPDAAARARVALAELRREADAGRIPAGSFYDRLEQILRSYLVDTRAWPATRPVRAARETAVGAMHDLHRQAVLSRFAAVEASIARLLMHADASLDWIDEDAA